VAAEAEAQEGRFLHRLPELRAARALLLLRRGRLPETAGLPPPLQIRILLARDEAEAAGELLETWTASLPDRADEGLRALVLRALVEEAGGRREAALAATADALARAEAGGHLRLFADEGEAMRGLIRELGEGGHHPEYCERILTAFALPAPAPAKVPSLLSAREGEVLALLAAGLSNQAIAEGLFVSPHTVKIHVRNIFAKLGASSRTAAAAKARTLGLVP
jgi:LuxR family maltose regulon positive regulatory protein